jgi:hypothetical protein
MGPPPIPVVNEGVGGNLPEDYRTLSDYKLITYSGYSRSVVNTQLLKRLEQADYETSFYWAAELMCAGHWEDVWYTVLHYICIHVNVGNVLLPGYVWKRMGTARAIVHQESGAFEYRNNADMRILLAELITVAIMAKQTPPIILVKVRPEVDLCMNLLSSKLEATASYTDRILLPKDTHDIKVPLNEFMYHLGYSTDPTDPMDPIRKPNMMHACYWMEWVLLFEQTCRSKKCPLTIQARTVYEVQSALQSDVVFVLWDTIRLLSSDEHTPLDTQKQKAIQYLIQLFCHSYTRTNLKKRKSILYYAISIATAESLGETTLLEDPVLWETLKSQLYKIYNVLQDPDTNPFSQHENLESAFLGFFR